VVSNDQRRLVDTSTIILILPPSTVFPSSRGAHTAESDTFEVLELYGTTGKCVVLMAIDGKGKFIHIIFGTNIISVWNQHLRGV
jgi:hypothetical protein